MSLVVIGARGEPDGPQVTSGGERPGLPTVTLRKVVEEDLEIFHRHQSDPVSIEMARVRPRDKAAYLARWRQFLQDDSFGKRTVLAGGEVAGQVISFDRDGVRELGYWIGREFWGQGIAGTAVRQYLGMELHRPLFAIVAEHNEASRRILARCGFLEESRKGDALHYQLSARQTDQH
jgi:RimJ/RimL family protein N-acetyltransferase